MKQTLTAIAALLLATSAMLAADAPQPAMDAKSRTLFNDYCVKCHGAEKQKGKFRVDDLPLTITNVEAAERWQKVLNQMNSGEMPPEEEKQVSNELKTDFLDNLSNTMVAARRALADRNGAIIVRRLNRREYGNSLRELLGVAINVTELPADTGNGSFDTVGANLFMSGDQFEQYLGLGRSALDEAFEWQAAMGQAQTVHVEAEEVVKHVRQTYENDLDGLERAKKWVALVDAAIERPENAAVVAELRKTAKTEDSVRREWATIKGAPAPEDFGFKTVENSADLALRKLGFSTKAGIGYGRPYREAYLNMPALDRGAYLTIGGGGEMLSYDCLTLQVPYQWKSIVGDYVLRVRLAATDKATPDRRFVEFGIDPRQGPVISTHQVSGTMDAPQTIEIPITLTRQHKESNRTLYIREKGAIDHFLVTRRVRGAAQAKNGIGPEFAIWVDWMELERLPDSRKDKAGGIAALGIPLDDHATPESAEVRAALERFCVEAFRGVKPETAYLDRLSSLYELRLKTGDKHSGALKRTLAVVLSSPQFLYLAEPAPDEKRRPLTAPELATRLSYFLWGAPPDATLRVLSASGDLLKPEVLAAQTTRLLEDARSTGFTRPFVHQWLGLDRLDFFEFNREVFPRFDNSTKLAARQEVFETFEHILRHGASVRDLLKCDYAVINPVLGDYYGIAGVKGDGFQKVSLAPDLQRGGLLGMAAVLAMGGNGERTNPVERGAWVLRKLLNDPPPPAPANVPQIARLAGKALTTLERLQAHQEEAQCASCHRKIDPIGFGLENFDAAGQWRTQDTYQVKDDMGKPVKDASKTWTIEPSATLHKGPAFKSYSELRDIIAARGEAFARGFSMALIEFALGRPIGFRDEALADEMIAHAKRNDDSMREFIRALVASQEFHTK